jgi:hypothetical protein
MKPRYRVPFLLAAVAALVTGILGGLLRMGWSVPGDGASWALLHGPLMVSAFFGTLIGLERAVASRRLWAYAAPFLSGLGGILLITGIAQRVGLASGNIAFLFVAAAAVTLAVFARILNVDPSLHHKVMAAGAGAWFIGNLLWAFDFPLPLITYWWISFLVLTIAGERLELNRLLPPRRHARSLFVVAIAFVALGAGGAFTFPEVSVRVFGAGLFFTAAWLARYDVAQRTVRGKGLTRFIAVCMLSGYAWLAAAGLMLMAFGHVPAGPMYDAALHAFFVGFVFAMVFGHAPIIFPAILGIPIPYRKIFYLHLALLHGGLAIRIAGNFAGDLALRQWGGALNAAAIALFFVMTIASTVVGIIQKNTASR